MSTSKPRQLRKKLGGGDAAVILTVSVPAEWMRYGSGHEAEVDELERAAVEAYRKPLPKGTRMPPYLIATEYVCEAPPRAQPAPEPDTAPRFPSGAADASGTSSPAPRGSPDPAPASLSGAEVGTSPFVEGIAGMSQRPSPGAAPSAGAAAGLPSWMTCACDPRGGHAASCKLGDMLSLVAMRKARLEAGLPMDVLSVTPAAGGALQDELEHDARDAYDSAGRPGWMTDEEWRGLLPAQRGRYRETAARAAERMRFAEADEANRRADVSDAMLRRFEPPREAEKPEPEEQGDAPVLKLPRPHNR